MDHKAPTSLRMFDTAENVADRYSVSRARQDQYALESQQRTAAAQAAGHFDDEIVPMTVQQLVTDKETGETSGVTVTLAKDEGNRPSTTLDGLAGLRTVFAPGEGGHANPSVTAGNSSQLSDGASVSILMDAEEAKRRGIEPLGYYRGVN